MANFIELIYSKSAVKEAEQVLQTLSKTHEEILKLSKVNLDFYGGTTPKNPQQLKNIIADVEKLEKAQTQATQKLIQNTEKQRLAEIKLDLQREKAFDRNVARIDKEQQKLTAALNLYNKTQTQINNITKVYNDLSTRKLRYNNLTENEEKRLNTLSKTLDKYNHILKGVDATVGKHGRNVGNYAMQNSQLSGSINQLTREMPAFANSAQTGFMAISNNLPIFFDAISNTQKQIKALRDDGQQVPSLFKQLTSSLFSWGTALSVGVTLLTLFGDEIVDSIFNTKAKAKADEEAQKAVEKKNEAEKKYIETIKNAGGEEIARSKILFENARNVNISMDDRLKYIAQLRESYPKYLKNLSDQQILAGDTADAENRLNDALLKRGIALAIQDKITEKYKELVGEILKEQEQRKKLLTINQDVKKSYDDQAKSIQDNAKGLDVLRKQQDKFGNLGQKIVEKRIENSLKSQKATKDEIMELFKLFNMYSPYLDILDKNTSATAKNTKAKEKNNEILKFGTEKWLEDQIKKLEEIRQSTDNTTESYQLSTKTIQFYSDWLDRLRGTQDKLTKSTEDLNEAVSLTDEELYSDYYAWLKLREAANEYIDLLQKGYLEDSLKNIGLESAKMFLDFDKNGKSTFDKLMEGLSNAEDGFKRLAVGFQSVGDLMQDVYSLINQQSEANYQRELSRLESQKELAIKYAGDSTTAKEEIERQYEERRRQLERRKAEQEKQKAIFNIIIDTAQAVVGALAEQNYFGAIAFGLLGAAQLAIVNSQQVPAYEKGTENHKGGLMLVNDAKGSKYQETVITPDGKTFKPKGRNVLMSAPKGTKVKTAEWTESLNNILFEAGINGISTPIYDKVANTLTANDLDNVMGKYFANIQTNHTVMDASGITNYMVKNGQKTIRLDNRVSFKGFSV